MQITRQRDGKSDEKQYTESGAQTMKKKRSSSASLVSSKVSPRERTPFRWLGGVQGGLGRRVGRRGKDQIGSGDAAKYIPAGCVVEAFNKLASNKEKQNRKRSRLKKRKEKKNKKNKITSVQGL